MVSQTDNHRRDLTAPTLERWVKALRSAAMLQWSNPLSRGGLALLINTGLTGVLGFGYWIIAARLFPRYAVGVAGALVAASTLFSGLGQLNLSGMLMRFLPKAKGKSRRLVLLAYGYTAFTSAILASISLEAVRFLASPTSPLRLNMIHSTIFVLSVIATAIFTIQDSVLIGVRRTVWVPAENGSFGLAKIGILFILAPLGTAFAIFGAWMIPLTLTIPVISAVLFHKFLPPASKPRSTAFLGRRMRSRIIRFTIGDAAGGLFSQGYTYLPPIIITASLGASVNALYFVSFLFSSTVDQVSINYASPLTVEGVHAPDEIPGLIRSTLRHIFTIILPIVTALIIMCPWLVRAFGEKYVGAVPAMRLLLIACLPKAISTVYYAYCRIQRNTNRSAIMQAYVCIATLSAVVLARPFGLTGICVAIVGVQTSIAAISSWALRKGLRIAEHGGGTQGRHRRRRRLPAGIMAKSG